MRGLETRRRVVLVSQAVKEMDPDSDGEVTLDEFVHWWREARATTDQDQASWSAARALLNAVRDSMGPA